MAKKATDYVLQTAEEHKNNPEKWNPGWDLSSIPDAVYYKFHASREGKKGGRPHKIYVCKACQNFFSSRDFFEHIARCPETFGTAERKNKREATKKELEILAEGRSSLAKKAQEALESLEAAKEAVKEARETVATAAAR